MTLLDLFRFLIVRVASLGVVLLCVACASAPQRPPGGVPVGDTSYLEQRLAYEIREVMEDEEVTSLAVSVVDDTGPLYEQAFGLSDKEHNVAATVDTPYRWGSNSKLFVMLSLLQLSAEGKVDLDAPLTTYIPEFRIGPPPAFLPESKSWKLEQITLRTMLAHHSGLPNDVLSGMLKEHPFPLEELPARMKGMYAQHPVGFIHSYSNAAFGLLGIVVQRVSGQSFDDYVREHIFRPAGMSHASFAWTPELERRVARPYDFDGKLRKMYRISVTPAGSLMATPREMGRFATALLRGGQGEKGRVIDTELLESSYERQNARVALDFDLKQGLAWFIDTLPVDRFGHTVRHGGGILSHFSAFIMSRDHEVAVLAATNSQRGAPAVHKVAMEALALALEVKTGKPTPPEPDPVKLPAVGTPSSAELDRWVGHYSTVLGDSELVRDDDQLTFELFDRRFFLRQHADGTMGLWTELWGLFDVQPGNMGAMRVSLLDVGGRKIAVDERPDGRRYMGCAYTPVKADATWRKRVGSYRLVKEEDAFAFLAGFQLLLDADGQLLARPIAVAPADGLPPAAGLHPLNGHAAVTQGFGRNRGVRFVFDEQGNLELGGLHFEREKTLPNK